ncbi:threonine/serine exporter family protein [Oryzibacter oryziterrae]|uniref:threonine/serine exporter family protein n=1 Tax=Oryzibacter oryziterrae TaxID=2766474 RepID=UPI001F388AED|nr:threonine/serine exporter family protein [Oryzibacter oryziterrae]
MEPSSDPVVVRHRELERFANATLKAGRILMECGASVHVVHEGMTMIARGFGVEGVGIRSGYASLAITVTAGDNTITRMISVGRHAVNHRLDQAVRALAVRVSKGGMTVEETETELVRLARETPRHAPWFVALAVGLACTAFGRLFGVDWAAFLPVWAAGGIGQYIRHQLLHRGVNVFIVAGTIAFIAATLGGLGAMAVGSKTINLAMMASILLLVPGVPATNAQTDIMDGYPTMGSARAVTVLMIMVFAATGVWLAEALLGVRA